MIRFFNSHVFAYVFSLVLILGFCIPAAAEFSFKSDFWEPLYNGHIQPTLKDGFDENGLWILGAGTATTLVSLAFDDRIRQHWEDRQRMPEDLNDFADEIGTGRASIAILALQLAFDRNNGWMHLETLIGVRISKTLIKRVVRRKRPNDDERDTLPSGHLSTIAATATSLTYAYGWWVAIPGAALTILSGMNRLNDTRHYFSDLVSAAFLGYFWGRAPYKHHHPQEPSNFSILPDIDHEKVGLILEYKF